MRILRMLRGEQRSEDRHFKNMGLRRSVDMKSGLHPARSVVWCFGWLSHYFGWKLSYYTTVTFV